MLSYEPSERLSLEEILEHPWLKGPTATKEDVIEECKVRHRRNEEIKTEERKVKEQTKKTRKAYAGRTRAMKGEEEEEEEEELQ
jgi:serine/threonine protein kinase